CTLAQISSGSCSTHPGRGKCCGSSAYPRPCTFSSSSTRRQVVPVVPWSIARITSLETTDAPSGTGTTRPAATRPLRGGGSQPLLPRPRARRSLRLERLAQEPPGPALVDVGDV